MNDTEVIHAAERFTRKTRQQKSNSGTVEDGRKLPETPSTGESRKGDQQFTDNVTGNDGCGERSQDRGSYPSLTHKQQPTQQQQSQQQQNQNQYYKAPETGTPPMHQYPPAQAACGQQDYQWPPQRPTYDPFLFLMKHLIQSQNQWVYPQPKPTM